MNGDQALEHGVGGRAGLEFRYCRVWQRTPYGDWQIAREVWNGPDTPAGPGVQTLVPKPA